MKTAWSQIEPAVFLSSAAVVGALLVFGVVAPPLAKTLFLGLQDRIVTSFGWLFVAATASFLVFALLVGFAPTGRIRLGGDDEAPEYSRLSWFAMLFNAGMGIGIMFYGVAEPVLHYIQPPHGAPATAAAARQAMTITFFHWGLHAWAVYVVVGLAIAYFGHRKGLPLSVRSTLHPLLGERIHGRSATPST